MSTGNRIPGGGNSAGQDLEANGISTCPEGPAWWTEGRLRGLAWQETGAVVSETSDGEGIAAMSRGGGEEGDPILPQTQTLIVFLSSNPSLCCITY